VEPENISARIGAMNQSATAGEIFIFMVIDASDDMYKSRGHFVA
jgi:hypothetical protein